MLLHRRWWTFAWWRAKLGSVWRRSNEDVFRQERTDEGLPVAPRLPKAWISLSRLERGHPPTRHRDEGGSLHATRCNLESRQQRRGTAQWQEQPLPPRLESR